MRVKFFLPLFVLSSTCLGLLGQSSTTRKPQPTPHPVSLGQILAMPQHYDGQLVQLTGYLNLAYEANAIYRQQDDVATHQSKNGLWVTFSAAISKQQLTDCNQTDVVVIGTFDARSKGHLGLFGGTLRNIIYLDKRPLAK